MKHFKLIFNRFLEMDNLNVRVTADVNDATSKLKKVGSSFDEFSDKATKAADANDKFNNSLNTRSGRSNAAQPLINNLKATIEQTHKLLNTSDVSDKFKISANAGLEKLQLSGLMNKNPANMNTKDMNKLISTNKSFGLANASEYERQTKAIEKQITAEDKLLEQEKRRKDMLTSLANALGQVADKKEAEIQKTSSAMYKLRTALETVDNASKKVGTGFSKSIGKLKQAAITWRILSGVVQQVVRVFADVIDKAAAYEEAMNLYTVALGDYATQATEWRDKIAEALHLDPKYIMQYTGALFNLVQGLGVSEKAAYTMSTNLTQLAYDMSSYLNIDVQSAYDKLQSAMTGQSRAVASAGIAMQQASLQELAYSLGIKENVADMTQAEKTYLRYIQIMRSTANMQGDLARTIVTPENAIRVIRQQFELLGRAIGQVFIPIVMKAIPYVMALTQVLTELATKLASWAGFEFAKIDYSSLTTADTAVEDTFNNMSNSAAGAAKSIKGSVNRTLAAFDELNVVESETAGGGVGGGAGGGGIPGTSLSDLEPYITGYDMLKGLTDEFDKKVATARENLEKFGKVLLVIAGIIGTIKALKWTNTLLKWVDGFKKAWKEGTGLAGLLRKTMVPAFNALKTTLKDGSSVFSRMIDASGNLTGSLWKLAGAWAGTAAAATAEGKIVESSYKSYLEGGSSIEATTLKVTAATAALGLVAGALTGPIGVLTVAVGGLVGGTTAIMDYKAQMDQLAKNKEIYEAIYDGQGIKIKELTGGLEGLMTNTQNYLVNLDDLKDKYEKSKTSVETAKTSIDDFKNALNAQKEAISTSQIDTLKTYYDNYIEAIKNSANASRTYGQEIITSYSKIEGASKKTTAQRIADYLEAQKIEEGYSVEYAKRAKEIDLALYKGSITAEEAAKKHHALDVEFGLVAEDVVNADGVMKKFNDTVSDIDYSAMTPEQLETYFKNLSKTYNTTRTNLEKAKTDTESYFNGLIDRYKGYVANLEKTEEKQGYLTDAQKTKLKEYQGLVEKYTTQKETAVKGYTTGLEEIERKMKDSLAIIYTDLTSKGADVSTEFAGTIDSIKSQLGKLENVDMSEGAKKSVLTILAGAKKGAAVMGPQYTALFNTFGWNGMKELQNGIDKGWISVQGSFKSGFNYTIEKALPSWKTATEKAGIEAGKQLPKGATKGVSDPAEAAKWKKANEDLGISGQTAFRKTNGIHSPSTVYEEFGKNMVIGLANGITKNKDTAVNAIKGISKSLTDAISNTKLSFKFTSDIDGPLNKMLDKIRKFANKWKNAINDLLKKMQTSMNSVKLDDKNKVTYTPMGSITIPAFAQGGYPTSGDLFFANENGNAEYITSLGNKTAVANQDQMVKALTNAIIEGMSNIGNTQPGITQVYIGNKKVYEGQGEYQNRQAERYGTNIIKI